MRVPTIPTTSRLPRTRKFAVAGTTAAVAALALTAFPGSGTAAAAESADRTSGTVRQAVNAKPVSAASAGTPRQMARAMMDATQFRCFSQIVQRESSWNVHATNPSSGAYGLVQALPASKMASAGADWRTNPMTQLKWGLNYMNERYGSPCAAWSFWQANHWY